jgi:hypothetical protein
MASHFLEYSRPNKWVAMISVAVIAAILTIFILFTLNPPHLVYGIIEMQKTAIKNT